MLFLYSRIYSLHQDFSIEFVAFRLHTNQAQFIQAQIPQQLLALHKSNFPYRSHKWLGSI